MDISKTVVHNYNNKGIYQRNINLFMFSIYSMDKNPFKYIYSGLIFFLL